MTRAFIWLAIASCADSPSTCSESLVEFCTSSSPCPMTWSAAQDPASWGGCAEHTTSNPVELESCGDVLVANVRGVDDGTNYNYDVSTGELLSVTSHVFYHAEDYCVAGVPGAAVCNDPAPRNLCP